MIQVSHLTKSFHKQPPLWEDMNFEVPPHSVTAFTGHSGSGKSTLLNCIGALESPDSGNKPQLSAGPEISTRLCGVSFPGLRPDPRPKCL